MRTIVARSTLAYLLLAFVTFGCAGGIGSAVGDAATGSGQVLDKTAGGTWQSVDTIRVVTSISILGDLIRQVGQDRVTVRYIVPVGGEPHTFQPTPQDVRDISEADIAFLNGVGLEGPLDNLIRNAGKQGMRVVVLSEGLPVLGQGEQSQEGAGGNPHLWMDVRLAMQYVQRIKQALADIDPAGAPVYAANADRYSSDLADLDAWIEQQISTIPVEKRKLVVFHDAFPYYASRYGLELVGVVVRSPGREPSAKDIADLVNTIRREGVQTVFAEPQFNARVLEVAAREARVNIAELYSDSTDSQIASYEAMMRYDTEQIVSGLR
ncbi:MAG: zinc ABC transporter substrate-binding protein [Chloroflexi bacterium]|nr:zinc ABC transporter substrate-binding protein [Chloroflexota bacterium]